MSNKPFEIQSPSLSLNGVAIDTSAQGKLVIPGVTRAGTSVAIEVEDTGDQTINFGPDGDPTTVTVIDGYQFAVLNGDVQSPIVGWTAATYAVDALDGDGYIDGISVVDGGAGYTGEAVTYSQRMLASLYADPINNFNPGDWDWIPFKVRCGAGEISSEFGSGGGVVQRAVNFPYGQSGDTKGTIALDTDTPFGGMTYICTADYTYGENQDVFTVLNTTTNLGQPSPLSGYVPVVVDLSEYGDLLDFLANPPYEYDGLPELSFDGGDTWVTAYSNSGASWLDNTPFIFYSFAGTVAPDNGAEFKIRFTEIQVKIWKQLDNSSASFYPYGIFNDNTELDLIAETNPGPGSPYAEVWLKENDSVWITADGERNTWKFKAGGDLVFPDGSVQTTAYAGGAQGNGTGWGVQYGTNTTENENPYPSGQTFNSVTVDTAGNTYYFGGSFFEVTPDYVPLVVKIDPTGTVLWSTSITTFTGTAVGGQVIDGMGQFLDVYVEDETDNITTNLVKVTLNVDDGSIIGTEAWAPLNNDGIGIDIQKTWAFNNRDGVTMAVGFSGFTTGENRVITLTGTNGYDGGYGGFTVPKANVPGLTLDNWQFCYVDSTDSIYNMTESGTDWVFDMDNSTNYGTGTHTIQIPQNSNALVGIMAPGGGGVVTVGKPGASYESYRSTVFDPTNGAVYAVGSSNGISILSRFDPATMEPVWHKNINDAEAQLYLSDVAVDAVGSIYAVGDDDYGSGIITKVLANGTIAWIRKLDDNYAPYGMSSLNIAINANNEIVVAAGYYGSEFSQGQDIWIAKFDTEGTNIWQRSIGTAQNDYKGSVYSYNDCQGFLTADDTSFYLSLNVSYAEGGPGPANAGAIKLPLDGSDVGVWGSGDNAWTYREETWPVISVDIRDGSLPITDLVVEQFPYETTQPVLDTNSSIFPVKITQFGSAVSDRMVVGDQVFRLALDGSVVFPDGSVQHTAYPGSVPVSPQLENYNANGTTYTNQAAIDILAGPYTMIVLTSSQATGAYNSLAGPESRITEVSDMIGGLNWRKRSAYTDPNSNVHQRSEVWYAVNNTNQTLEGSVFMYFDNQFDCQSATISSWTNCNLDNPWTSSGPTFTNSLNSLGVITGQLNIHESNTTALALFAVPNNGAGYAQDWRYIVRNRNSGGDFYEYAWLSSKEFTKPQFNVRVNSNEGPNTGEINSIGITGIFDALVGVGSGLSKIDNGAYSVSIESDGRLQLADGKTYIGRINDDDVVVWTDETAEYLGLWYGGDRDVNSNDYGPEASFTMGQTENDDMYFGPNTGGSINRSWNRGWQANLDLKSMNWHFDGTTGDFTLPEQEYGGSISIKSIYYANTWFSSSVRGNNGNMTFAVGGEYSDNTYYVMAFQNGQDSPLWRRNFLNLDLGDGAGGNLPQTLNVQYNNDLEQVYVGWNEGNSTGVTSLDAFNGNINSTWAISPPADAGNISQNAFVIDGSNNPIIVGHTAGGWVEHLNLVGTRGVDGAGGPYIQVGRSGVGELTNTYYWGGDQWKVQSLDVWIQPSTADQYNGLTVTNLTGPGGVKTAVNGTDFTTYGASGGPGYIEVNVSRWVASPAKLTAILALSNITFTAVTGTLTPGVGQSVSTFAGSGSWYQFDGDLWHMDGIWTVVTGTDSAMWMATNEILSLSYGAQMTISVSTRTNTDGGIYYDSAYIYNTGTDYTNGDAVKILGSQLGGVDSTRFNVYTILNGAANKWYFDKGVYYGSFFVEPNDFAFFPNDNASGTVVSIVELETSFEVTINITRGVVADTGPGSGILFSDGNDLHAIVYPQGNSIDNLFGIPAGSVYRFVFSGLPQIQGNQATRSAGTNYTLGDYRVYGDGTSSWLALTSNTVDPLDLKNTIIPGADSSTIDTTGLGPQNAPINGAYGPIDGTAYYGWLLGTNIGGGGCDYDVNSLTVFDGTFDVRRTENQQALVWTNSWSRTFGGLDSSEYFNGVAYDASTSTTYAVGYFSSDNNTANINGLVMALDIIGNVIWQKFVGTTEAGTTGYGNSIGIDGKGNVIVIGQDDNGYTLVTKLKGSNGELVWQSREQNINSWNDEPVGVVDYNGDIYVGGTFYNGSYDQNILNITKLSSTDGQQLWSKMIRPNDGYDINGMWDTFGQAMTFSNGFVNWGGYSYNGNLGNSEAIAVNLPMDGGRIGIYGRYDYQDDYVMNWQVNDNSALILDPTTPYSNTSGLTITETNPTLDTGTNNDSFYERHVLTTGLPHIVFGDGSEIAHPGVAREAVDNGGNTTNLDFPMNGKFIYYNFNLGNSDSWIYVPSNANLDLPIGYTVTVVMGNFNTTAVVYVNADGNNDVSFQVAGSSVFDQQYWKFGGDGKAGIYTIMKVDTDTWMLVGPNIREDI